MPSADAPDPMTTPVTKRVVSPRMSTRRVTVSAFLALVATVGIQVHARVPAQAASTVSVPSSIDATGGSDVTAALVQFFASVPAGATVEFPDRAKYLVDGVLTLQNLQHVTIEGNDSQLVAPDDGKGEVPPAPRFRAHWPRLRRHVEIDGADTLVVRNLSVHGPNSDGSFVAALEGQSGFTVIASTHVVLDNVSVSNTFGDGVYVTGKSNDVVVRSSNFDKVGRQGVAIVSGSNVLVELDHFQHVARSVVDVEPGFPSSSVTAVHVQKNEIGSFNLFALAAGGAGANVNDLWFQDNHITGGNGIAVFVGMTHWARHGLHIIGNKSDVPGKVVSGSGRDGVIQLARIDGVEITGNQQHIDGHAPAVTLDGVCNLVMNSNEFPGTSREQVVTAPCGQVSAPVPRSSAAGKTPGKSSAPTAWSGTASGTTRRKDSTDSRWLIVGGVLGAAALAAFVVLLRRDRRRPVA